MVPHGIFGCASFQVMMPMPGRNISATATMVVVLVSILCSTPSVAQNSSRVSEITSSFFRSEEHTSELQSLMRISYAVFCLKKKKHTNTYITKYNTIRGTQYVQKQNTSTII